MFGLLQKLLLILFAGVFSVTQAEQYIPTGVAMNPIQVSEHVYYVSGPPGIATDNAGFISNAAFVVTGDGVVVFDALGSPALGNELLAQIREITDQRIVRVYLSHYHADHVYGVQVFEGLGSEIVGPVGSIRYLQSDAAQSRLEERRISLAPWVNEKTRLVEPDRFLENEERFIVGDVSFRAVNVGSAHSEGDLILYVETDNVLLSGDLIFEGRIPLLGSDNSGKWLALLAELKSSNISAIVPGHGRAARKPLEIIALTHDYLAYVRNVMSEAVENWVPFDEAYENADWSEFIEFPAFFEANRRNAYGVYLSLEKAVLAE